jgi:anti-anti-sigma regulatory factor
MAQLSWQIRKKADHTLVVFQGDIDERAQLEELSFLEGRAVFDLGGIRRLNSEGIRRWVNFIRRLEPLDGVAFVRCSVSFIMQASIISNLIGHAEIRSFYAPYVDSSTSESEERLMTPRDIEDPLAPPSFKTERGTLVLDEMPERYFAFLQPK